MSEKFCCGCRRHKAESQIASTKIVTNGTGKVTRYICVTCAETIQARAKKSQAAA